MAYSAISSSCSFGEIVKAEFGPSRGVDPCTLRARHFSDVKLHLASCHLSKCSKVNENGLILAIVSI